MNGLRFETSGAFVKALNTTKMNNPKKNAIDEISDTPMNHLSPTVPGMIILKKST